MVERISVVVPVHNGSRTIRRCIEALLAQDYPNDCYEILVVDNNSRDGTPDIVARFPRVRLLHQTSVQSSYVTRNLGIEQATGEIVAFTDSDCLPTLGWLRHLTAAFGDERVLAAGGQVLDGEAHNLTERFLAELAVFSANAQTQPGQFLPVLFTNNCAYRRSALQELGGFNPNLYTGGDIDLAWRLQIARAASKTHGRCVRYAPDAIVYHQHRSTVKGMFRQFRRHGFGEIFLSAMYKDVQGYPHTLRTHLGRMARQLLALLTYMFSFLGRLLRYPLHRDRYRVLRPLLFLVAESGNLWGKIQAVWQTRGLRLNPALRQWHDPGG